VHSTVDSGLTYAYSVSINVTCTWVLLIIIVINEWLWAIGRDRDEIAGLVTFMVDEIIVRNL